MFPGHFGSTRNNSKCFFLYREFLLPITSAKLHKIIEKTPLLRKKSKKFVASLNLKVGANPTNTERKEIMKFNSSKANSVNLVTNFTEFGHQFHWIWLKKPKGDGHEAVHLDNLLTLDNKNKIRLLFCIFRCRSTTRVLLNRNFDWRPS